MWRKMTAGLVIACAALLTVAETAHAQYWRGRAGYWGGRAYDGAYNGAYGAYNAGRWGVGTAYWGATRPYAWYENRPYYYGGYYAPNRYYEPYTYSYSAPAATVVAPAAYESYYAGPQQQASDTARVHVMVPTSDAQVTFDGHQTQQRGMERDFVTSGLQSGSNYSYMVRASWMENGRQVNREQLVQVRAGQETTVDFR